jgi:outer membrane biogenesis lipoprotein LolB
MIKEYLKLIITVIAAVALCVLSGCAYLKGHRAGVSAQNQRIEKEGQKNVVKATKARAAAVSAPLPDCLRDPHCRRD